MGQQGGAAVRFVVLHASWFCRQDGMNVDKNVDFLRCEAGARAV